MVNIRLSDRILRDKMIIEYYQLGFSQQRIYDKLHETEYSCSPNTIVKTIAKHKTLKAELEERYPGFKAIEPNEKKPTVFNEVVPTSVNKPKTNPAGLDSIRACLFLLEGKSSRLNKRDSIKRLRDICNQMLADIYP